MTVGRFELKYIIDAQQRADFLEACREGLLPDPHGKDAVYRVSSVYFDSPDFSAFWEKMDGEAIRSKYRLRYYSVDEETEVVAAAFMEIKHRINNMVYKQRLRLTAEGASQILQDASQLQQVGQLIDPQSDPDKAAIADIESAAAVGLEAKSTITYLREAWLGRHDNRLRVTFDSQGQAYPPHRFAEVASNKGESFLSPNQTILEVKFNHAIPRWIRDVLDQQHLVLNRFSKYAEGVRIPATQYAERLRQENALQQATAEKTCVTSSAPRSTVPVILDVPQSPSGGTTLTDS